MEHTNELSQNNKAIKKASVHHVLAQSYFLFFIAVISGLFLNMIFPIEISNTHPPQMYGIAFLLVGTYLIIWAQQTSRKGTSERREIHSLTHEHFLRGPYKYFRSPTHIGLTLLVFGYGLISNALFVVVTTLIFAVVSRFVYVKKEEKILEEKYGNSYSEYKKKVRM